MQKFAHRAMPAPASPDGPASRPGWPAAPLRPVPGPNGPASCGPAVGAAPVGWLAAGFVIPLIYLLGITAVTAALSRGVPAGVRMRLPVVLATMHMCWGSGFLTSPRRLHRVRGRSTTARSGQMIVDARE